MVTMSGETILAYALAMALFAAVPGPGVFAVVAQAMARGTFAAFALLTGIILGDIAFLLAAATGLGLLAAQLGELFLIVKLAGAAYLVWLGWQSWKAGTQPAATPETKDSSRKWSLMGGFAISISNPKVMIFYLAFLPPFLDLTTATAADIALLASITTAVTYVVLGFYILSAAKLRSTIAQPRAQKWLNRFSGTVMAGAGILVAARN